MVAASNTMGNSACVELGVGSVGSMSVPESVVPEVFFVNLKV
jgi:hypothetical protein